MNPAPFSALVSAMGAAVQHDEPALGDTIEQVPAEQLLRQAIRHKCTGFLFDALTTSTIRTPRARELLRAAKPHAQTALLQAPAIRAQLTQLSNALSESGVPHAVLKTGARLQEGERIAELTPMCDLDVLVPDDRCADAVASLAQLGYAPERLADTARFIRLHHHFAPLVAPDRPKPVEVHVALAAPWRFTLPATWRALLPYLEVRDPSRPYELRLNAFAGALHLVLHGAGIYRLYDAVLLATEIRKEPDLAGRLQRALSGEHIQPLDTNAMLALAARIAGIPFRESGRTRALLDWVVRRETLPLALRGRARWVDAWYGNGGSFRGTCTVLTARNLAKDAKWHGVLPAVRSAVGFALGSLGVAGYSAIVLNRR
jgi:hypothetical protein